MLSPFIVVSVITQQHSAGRVCWKEMLNRSLKYLFGMQSIPASHMSGNSQCGYLWKLPCSRGELAKKLLGRKGLTKVSCFPVDFMY